MPLAEFFREIANRELECDVIGFDGEARKTLLTHAWPGNVRELRQKIMGALKQANGNRKVAAELLGIGRTTLYNKLEEYGLKYKFQQS